MADLMQILTTNPLARQLGVPQPTRLRRGRELPSGPVVLAAVGGAQGHGGVVADSLGLLGLTPQEALVDTPGTRVTETDEDGRTREVPTPYPGKIGAVVVDATAATGLDDLETMRGVLRPALKALESSGRVIVVGLEPESAGAVTAVATQQALDGITRTVGKELRKGATANLVRVDLLTDRPTTAADLASTLSFLLEGRSAYVSGDVLHVGHAAASAAPETRPFEGQIVVVTGAGRGIGASIAETFARDGALVVGIDVPAGGEALSTVVNRIGGQALQLDITAPDAGTRIAAHVAQRFGASARIHTIVHNAGITRDKLLVNTDEQRWASVLEVNLASQLRINEQLLDPDLPGGLDDNGRIVGVSSVTGLAGNRGQANYAAAKAGMIGVARAMGADPRLAERGITVNVVAPGVIATEMWGKVPLVTRTLGERMNSLQQAGRPVDVAEAIGYLADPASGAVTGQVVRVDGQLMLGA
ncbi:3-oxoacyl-ACP reductase [Ornithinimicrobium tianjinense]|uniref:3-oxoacyl-ACP reductase n=1 Tax=Ornithinimicrobium tianjinense TaxID=1195761 RepID=A0A917BRV1_9MICO|nr:3-oxoacyl-ACP reductase [Ornithinimicrobium tianjinense]GGF55148.1 3-oxoacyl-ACP reductase [Ornithinimicrobium tianjinense]